MKNNLVKILATIGLVIAIALILQGVFDIGKIGLKNLFSKGSSLPVLQCTFNDTDGSKYDQVYNLASIYKLDPLKNIKNHEEKKKITHRDGTFMTMLSELDDPYYSIHVYKNKDRVARGYTVTINRKTGEAEFYLPLPRYVDATVEQFATALVGGQKFSGMCIKLKDKKL